MQAQESFSIHGDSLLEKVKELIAAGNASKITVTDKEGKELMTFPVTVGVAGAIIAPVLAAVGAIAAIAGECTITVEKRMPAEVYDESDHLNQP